MSAVSAASHGVLLLTPLTPDEVRRSTAAPGLGRIRWAVLDRSDPTRLSRLRTRPSVGADENGALIDTAELRALGLPVLDDDGISLDAAVDVVVRWARTT